MPMHERSPRHPCSNAYRRKMNCALVDRKPESDEAKKLIRRMLRPGFYVSLDRVFKKDDTEFWRTQSNEFIRVDQLAEKKPSDFSGVVLGDKGWTLPIAFVQLNETPVFYVDETDRLRGKTTRASKRERVAVVEEIERDGMRLAKTSDDVYLKTRHLTFVRPTKRPEKIGHDERWIDVDLSTQTLAAYEGDKPVFATLISSGKRDDGEEGVEGQETPTGTFRIRAKHLSAMMDGESAIDGPYSLDDVPYIMYFHKAYAFHAAFWHDKFGERKSHGCVNLSPQDAQWLFRWAGPDMPDYWHGAYAREDNPGTLVFVREN